MSVTLLRELDATVPSNRDLLDLFQHCRVHVVAVAATPLIPDYIAVTTKNGFVELIDTNHGEFQLFLSHLDSIPLDTSLRCFSLVPSYLGDDAVRRRGITGGPFLAFSLAYSNELLLADLSTGQTTVLFAFKARPRSLFCDGDYLVCGEGSGEVVAWRANADAARGTGVITPGQLWQRPIFNDAVAVLRVHRDELICASAGCDCVVLSIDTGLLVARVPRRPSPLVAMLPLMEPLMPASVVALCSTASIDVYTGESRGSCSSSPRQASVTAWSLKNRMVLDVEMQCATCFGGFLAAGTASGVVLLCRCDAASGEVGELVRFDVGHSVVGMQLYASETLVVVTAAGDVWKWPLKDLLEGTEEAEDALARDGEGHAEEHVTSSLAAGNAHQGLSRDPPIPSEVSVDDDDDDDGPRPSDRLPQPTGMVTQPPAVDRTAIPDSEGTDASFDCLDDKNTSHELQQPHTSFSSGDAPGTGSPDTSAVGAGESASPPTLVEPVVVEQQPPAESEGVTEEQEPTAEAEEAEGGEVEVEVSAEEFSGPTSGDLALAASPFAKAPFTPSTKATSEDSGSETATVRPRGTTSTVSGSDLTASLGDGNRERGGGGGGATSAPAPRQQTVRAKSRQVALDVGPQMSSFHAQQLAETWELLGGPPPPTIPGLSPGRRVDRRKVAHALESELINQEIENSRNGGDATPTLPKLQSTATLLEQKAALKEATFDYAAYAKEHALEAGALRYQHPIRPVRYSLKDRVFEPVTGESPSAKRIQGGGAALGITAGGDVEQAVLGGHDQDGARGLQTESRQPQRQHADVKDDLMDVTHGRLVRRTDRQWDWERRRKGPDIHVHPCGDLLVSPPGPSGTVLFKEYQIKPSEPQTLMLPMPLPQTPSVF